MTQFNNPITYDATTGYKIQLADGTYMHVNDVDGIIRVYPAVIIRLVMDHVRTHICPNVYAIRPSADVDNNEMVCVFIPEEASDKGVCINSTLSFQIFVKNRAKGIPNLTRLDALLNDILELFPIGSAGHRFSASNPRLTFKGNDGLGYTCWMVEAKLIVNTTDKFDY